MDNNSSSSNNNNFVPSPATAPCRALYTLHLPFFILKVTAAESEEEQVETKMLVASKSEEESSMADWPRANRKRPDADSGRELPVRRRARLHGLTQN